VPSISSKLAEKLDADCVKTLAFFEKLSPKEWQLKIYSEGTCWNPEKILAHFVITETGFISLMKNITSGGKGVHEDFDIDDFNERQVAKLQHVVREDLIDRFVEARKATISFVNSLKDEDMVKTGRHPFLGIAPIEDIVKLIYRHNQIHLREIRKTLANPS
jgi:hypothetical protein